MEMFIVTDLLTINENGENEMQQKIGCKFIRIGSDK